MPFCKAPERGLAFNSLSKKVYLCFPFSCQSDCELTVDVATICAALTDKDGRRGPRALAENTISVVVQTGQHPREPRRLSLEATVLFIPPRQNWLWNLQPRDAIPEGPSQCSSSDPRSPANVGSTSVGPSGVENLVSSLPGQLLSNRDVASSSHSLEYSSSDPPTPLDASETHKNAKTTRISRGKTADDAAESSTTIGIGFASEESHFQDTVAALQENKDEAVSGASALCALRDSDMGVGGVALREWPAAASMASEILEQRRVWRLSIECFSLRLRGCLQQAYLKYRYDPLGAIRPFMSSPPISCRDGEVSVPLIPAEPEGNEKISGLVARLADNTSGWNFIILQPSVPSAFGGKSSLSLCCCQ